MYFLIPNASPPKEKKQKRWSSIAERTANGISNNDINANNHRKTNIDFNSRVILPPKLSLQLPNSQIYNIKNTTSKKKQDKIKQYETDMQEVVDSSESNSSKNLSQITSSQSIKLKLQQILSKNSKNQQSEGGGPSRTKLNRLKFMYLKNSYKMNKSKKQLESLSKKSINMGASGGEDGEKKRENSSRSGYDGLSNRNPPPNLFMIKQIKPPLNWRSSTPKSVYGLWYEEADEEEPQTQTNTQLYENYRTGNLKQHYKNKSQMRQSSIVSKDIVNYEKFQSGKVFNLSSHENQWELSGGNQRQGRKVLVRQSSDLESFDYKEVFNTMKGRAKNKLLLRKKKNQQQFTPWVHEQDRNNDQFEAHLQ